MSKSEGIEEQKSLQTAGGSAGNCCSATALQGTIRVFTNNLGYFCVFNM